MIRDLEAILLTISDLNSRRYVQESVVCYHAGAYRAAVVLAVAAGMEGLRQRLDTLAASGGASQAIRDDANNIAQAFADQQAYESTLINACEKDASFFTAAEAKKARLLLQTRHLCAHPSGHSGSPEEARDAITSVIDLVLTRPATLGMAGVSGIIARLDNPTFFPKTTPEKIAEVAGDELNSLHGDLAPALIAKLYAEIVDATKSKTIRSNALLLVCGLAMRAGSAREAVWRNIDRVAENAGFALEALKIVCADPQGIALARPLVRERLISLIRRNMKDAGARRAVHKLTVSNQLTGVERDEIAVALASLDASDEQLVKFTTEAALVEAETLIFRRIVDHCRDHSFATANKAIDLLQELDDDVANRFSQELKVDYLINLGYNAGRTYPATSAAAIVKNGLDVRSGFADALLEEARLRPDRLRAANTEWEKIAKLCEHSNRHDVLLPLIEVFSASEPDDAAQKMTFYLKSNSQPEIANAASAEHARIIDSML